MPSKSPVKQSIKSDDKSENMDGQELAAGFGARLRDRAAELRISRSNLISWTSAKKQTFAGYWNGERLPPATLLFALAEELDVSPRWLLKGESVPGPATRDDPDDLVEVDEIDLRYGLGSSDITGPIVAEKRTFSREWLSNFTRAKPEQLFWAIGQGDSMSPTIQSGEVILIDRSQDSLRDRDLIWACALGDFGMIKRLRPERDGSITILSDNPHVPDDSAADGELFIIGRVVAKVARL